LAVGAVCHPALCRRLGAPTFQKPQNPKITLAPRRAASNRVLSRAAQSADQVRCSARSGDPSIWKMSVGRMGPDQPRASAVCRARARDWPAFAFTLDSSRCLNGPSNLTGHHHPAQPADGEGITGRFFEFGSGRAGTGRPTTTRRRRMFQGYIDLDTAAPVDASAVPDALFERGLYWASGRSGVVNLVAAHKWFNLAALKGRADAIPLRREVAEMMSEVEIAKAQREARDWMTAN